jgi:hypothetical protein
MRHPILLGKDWKDFPSCYLAQYLSSPLSQQVEITRKKFLLRAREVFIANKFDFPNIRFLPIAWARLCSTYAWSIDILLVHNYQLLTICIGPKFSTQFLIHNFFQKSKMVLLYTMSRRMMYDF